MKLNKVTIENFKAIEKYEYVPENKLAVLCAENGKGKTSFLEAIRFGLCGTTPAECINDAAMSTTVTMELDNGAVFSRTKHREKPTKVKYNGKTIPAKQLDTIITDETGVGSDVAKIISSQEVVAAMKPDELGSFLLGYIPEELDFDTIVSQIPAITPEHISILQDYLPPMPITFGMDAVEKAYEQIFSARSFAKKDKYHRDAQIDPTLINAPARTLADIETEEKELYVREGAQKSAEAARSLYEAAIRNKEKAEKEIETVTKEIAANSSTKPIKEQLEALLNERSTISTEITRTRALIVTLDNNIKLFENTMDNLNKPVCPISEKLVCTTDKTTIKEELTELLVSNKEGVEIQRDLLTSAIERLDETEKKIERYRENANSYEAKVALIRRLEFLKANIPEIPPCPASITTRVDYTERRKEIMEEKRYYERYARNEKLRAESEIFGKRYGELDFLCSALEPKGVVMNSITAHYLEDFETVINSRAAELGTGYAVRFENNEGILYTIKTPHVTTYRPYENLSNGEKIVAILLMLDMLNTLCGLRVLMIDDINHLDSTNFMSVFEFLSNPTLQEDYDHIFMCSATNTDVDTAIKSRTDVDRIF